MDKAGSGSSPCCRDDEGGELLVIWGKEAGAGWPLGDHWSQGCLSPEVVDVTGSWDKASSYADTRRPPLCAGNAGRSESGAMRAGR